MAKSFDNLLPGEEIIDSIRASSCDMVLTDRRIVGCGSTDALGVHYTLLKGQMLAALPLAGFDSAILGTGRRPLLLVMALMLAVAGVVMFTVPAARYPAFGAFAGAALLLMLWAAWTRTFLTISAGGIHISGTVKRGEALVFLERVQLAAHAARAGKSLREIRDEASRAGGAEALPKAAAKK